MPTPVVQFTDAAGNQWQRKVQSTLVVQPGKPIPCYPSGDFSLPRFKSKWITIAGIPAGDTLSCVVKAKLGQPFKWVKIHFSDGQTVSFENADSAGYYAIPPAGVFRVQIKAQPSLKRQVATLQISRTPPLRYDTLLTTTDILIKPGKDSLVQTIRNAANSAGVQTAWSGVLSTDKPGEQIKRKRTLVVQDNPAKTLKLSPAGTMRIRHRRETRLTYDELAPGDTLKYSVTCRGKAELSEASLTDQDNVQLAKSLNTPVFQGMLVISRQTSVNLVLKAKKLFKKTYADVNVWRIRPTPSDSFYQTTDSLFRSSETIIYDTTAITILNDSLQMEPLWNLEGKPTQAFQIRVPKKLAKAGDLHYIAYWYGASRAETALYTALEATIPPDWSRPGLPNALGAYALGHPVALPETTSTDLEIAFTSAAQKTLFQSKKKYKKLFATMPNFDTVKASELSSLGIQEHPAAKDGGAYEFYLCFNNRSTVNTYQTALKVAGFYRKVKTVVKTTAFIETKTSTELLKK